MNLPIQPTAKTCGHVSFRKVSLIRSHLSTKNKNSISGSRGRKISELPDSLVYIVSSGTDLISKRRTGRGRKRRGRGKENELWSQEKLHYSLPK